MFDYEFRTCVKCGETKHFKEFYYYFKKGKFHTKCKECESMEYKQWREDNKEYLKLKAKRDAEFNKRRRLLDKEVEIYMAKERRMPRKMKIN